MNDKIRLPARGLMAVAAWLLFTTCAMAEWRVDIESKVVAAGETGVTIDITAYWDSPLAGFVLPVIVREIDPGSFWTGTLPYDTGGNAGYHPYIHGVAWNWVGPWAYLIEAVRPAPSKDTLLWCDPPADSLYDGVSPDQFVMLAIMPFGGAAAAPQPDGRAIVSLTFDVTAIPGEFEFDTACYIYPQPTVGMTDYLAVEHGPMGTNEVTFNKGVITIVGDCYCPAQGDCNDDGSIGPLDVIWMFNYALRKDGPPPPGDPHCPVLHRGDWDCNDRLNLADIVKMIDYVYRLSGAGPCDPCAEN